MASLNRVSLLGNVGNPPEVRRTQSGSAVANFSLATSETWTDKNTGERKEKTEWHRITVWNDKLVEIVQKYIAKGSQLYVEGKLQTRKWQDQSGQDRYSTDIVIQGFDGKIVLLGDPRGGGQKEPQSPEQFGRSPNRLQPQPAQRMRGNDPISSGPPPNDMDDEIPF